MVSSTTPTLKKVCNLQALFSLFNWFKIVCSSCFRTRQEEVLERGMKKCLSEARMRRSGKGTDSSLAKVDLVKGNANLEAATEQQSVLSAWEFPSHGKEEGDMFEGVFYVGSKVQTEVEMRSPVEESKGMTTIIKAPRSPRRLQSSQPCSNHDPPAASNSVIASEIATNSVKIATNSVMASKIDIEEAKNRKSSNHSSSPSSQESKSKPIDITSTIKVKNPSILLPDSEDEKRNDKLQDHPSSMIADENAEISPAKGIKPRRSITDNDFAELRGCIDLGFVFTQDDIPDLRETLPALEVCYAISQNLQDPQATLLPCEDSGSPLPESPSTSPTISSWKIASPGDQPQQVKARLRHWAQAVACNVRQSC